jgi:hypothetical protein
MPEENEKTPVKLFVEERQQEHDEAQAERKDEIKRQELLLEVEIVEEVKKPKRLGRTEWWIVLGTVIFGAINIILNLITLGPDVLRW